MGGAGRLSRDICPRVNSDFVSSGTFALFNKIISAVKYCLSSFSIKPNIELGMGSHITGTKKAPPAIALSFAFLRRPGLFVSAKKEVSQKSDRALSKNN
jgi:hypothetical protein